MQKDNSWNSDYNQKDTIKCYWKKKKPKFLSTNKYVNGSTLPWLIDNQIEHNSRNNTIAQYRESFK